MISNWTRLQLVDQDHGDTRDIVQRKDDKLKEKDKDDKLNESIKIFEFTIRDLVKRP